MEFQVPDTHIWITNRQQGEVAGRYRMAQWIVEGDSPEGRGLVAVRYQWTGYLGCWCACEARRAERMQKKTPPEAVTGK